MVGAPDVVQPWMPRAARESDACLWHVSLVGGARRRGCAAAGVPLFFNGPLVLWGVVARLDPRVSACLWLVKGAPQPLRGIARLFKVGGGPRPGVGDEMRVFRGFRNPPHLA